jgi:hypothetical protein
LAAARRGPPGAFPGPGDGKLRYAEGLHIGYRAWLRDNAVPALPFGSGLGYTTWRFDTLAMLGAADGPDATARVTLTNTGPRHGTQTVQVYLSRPDSAVERPARWLAGFARASADPGDAVTVDVTVRRRQFAHWFPRRPHLGLRTRPLRGPRRRQRHINPAAQHLEDHAGPHALRTLRRLSAVGAGADVINRLDRVIHLILEHAIRNAARRVARDEHPPTADIDPHRLNVQVSATPRAA